MHTCNLASLVAGQVGPLPHLRLISILLVVACATSTCGTLHTCWLIHYLRGVLLPPLFSCTYLQGGWVLDVRSRILSRPFISVILHQVPTTRCVAANLRFHREHPTNLVPFTAKWLPTSLCTYVSVKSCQHISTSIFQHTKQIRQLNILQGGMFHLAWL